jgi:hypothetical protein
MKRTAIALAGLIVIVGLSPLRAEAQSNRTFVSGQGLDTNPCTLTAPCRSFAQAINLTSAGGEITILDPAGYGAVTITKAISIVNDGVGEAGVTVATSGDGVTINAGASDVVNLRGLTLVGGGVGTNGITFNTGGTLNMQNCVIRGFTNNGINAVPNAVSNFNISDTVVSNNGADGIFVGGGNTGFGGPIATLTRVQAIRNAQIGIAMNGNNTPLHEVQGTATNVVVTGNGGSTYGFVVSQRATLTIVASSALYNGIGIEDNGTVYLTQSTVSGNTFRGYDVFGGVLNSFGDNNIANNVGNGGSLTPISHQ